MNKISKKIVALATMAAFVLTLVPAAAFGAVSSSVAVQEDYKEISLPAGDTSTVDATVDVTVGTGDANDNIVLWVEKDGGFYRHVTYKAEGTSIISDGTGVGTPWNGRAVLAGAPANTDIKVTITFQEAGTYKVCAGVSADNQAESVGDLDEIGISDEAGTIVVTNAETYVESIDVPAATATQGQGGGTISYDGVPNGIRSTTVIADVVSKYVDDSDKEAPSKGKTVTISNPYGDALTILNADGKATNDIVVNSANQAVFKVKAASTIGNGTYTLTLSADNATYLLSIVIGTTDTEAATISVVDTGKTAIDKDTITKQYTNLDSVAQFTVKNADGDILTPQTVKSGFSAFNAGSTTADAVENIGIISAPEDGEDAVFKVVASTENTDNFVLQLASAPNTLAVGKYTVRVSLDNGNTADVTFTVAKFGKVVDTVIEFAEKDTNKVVSEVVDNETVYTATALQVDENGLTRPLKGASMGYTGAALKLVKNDAANGVIEFTVNDDVDGNDNALVGSKIGIWAFTTAYGQYAYGEVTVADEDNIFNYTLSFDPTNGPAGEDNIVDVTVVDEDGDKVNVNGTLKVYLLDKSNEDANVYVNPTTGSVNKGVGKLTINSDKETDLEVVVGVISNDTNSKDVVFANTLNYTVGAEDVNADTTVVMTIGSTDYVVNNDIVAGDAAPYIDSAWRTMVPFRVLGETFGATVNWDQDAQTVTYTLGDTELTMTIGEETYTVNGDEKTMDTAPVLSGDRTFVPVRFVAEALGYTVTPLQDANGLTASVVFQK